MITSVSDYMQSVNSAADYISSKLTDGVRPEICIVLGSGLAPLVSMCEDTMSIPYSDIPGFPVSTVPGHEGRLIIGTLSGKKVYMMSGRFHYYEGYDTSICTLYVRVMKLLGVKTLVLTNAAGGINEDMQPAELMAIQDHLSFFCESPLRGANLDEFGVRFPDQSAVYDPEYLDILDQCAEELDITLHRGVYIYCKGPQYESPSEIQVFKAMGASAVGMSTVPEAIVATHCGIRTVAVSCITNLAAGISPVALSHAEVMENAAKASDNSCNLVKTFISKI